MIFKYQNELFWLLETFSDFNNESFRRFADAQNTWVWANNLKYEQLKLEKKVNSRKCLFYYFKCF